jgi:hypothetical protein
MLGRIIELKGNGITWQGDPRHVDLLRDYYGTAGDTKTLSKNGYDDDPIQESTDDEELTPEEGRAFRGLAARLNYMAMDNMFVQFPAKEICRNMSNPRFRDFMNIMRVVSFMKAAGSVMVGSGSRPRSAPVSEA